MKNKLWLTSIFALCIAGPAFGGLTQGGSEEPTEPVVIEGQIANAEGLLDNMGCDEGTLGITEGSANIEAIWTPNTYDIKYYCEQGRTAKVGVPTICRDVDNADTEQCSDRRVAVYDRYFLFADIASCNRSGYTVSGWSCTQDSNPNAGATTYTLGQRIASWQIESDLTCMAVYTGNTIGLNWYDSEHATTPSSTSQCTYGTISGQGALTLPSQPTAPAGYSFGGWKMVENVCERFDTSGTCNMNSSCFWYVNENTNEGSCVNMDSTINGCADASSSRAECEAIGYCRWSRMTLTGIHCGTNVATICHGLNENQCNTHSMSNGCYWESSTQECITQSERDLAPAM